MHFLHPVEVQRLHSVEGRILHAGSLKAKDSPGRTCKKLPLANRRDLHAGKDEIFACRPEGNKCMLANWNILHSGWVSREGINMRQAVLSGFNLQRDEYPFGPAEYSHQIKEEFLHAVFSGVDTLYCGGFLRR